MPLRLIPVVYIVASLLAGVIVPRLEHAYLADYTHGMSVASALTFFSAVSSGMMALTGVVFAISFLVVQFSALAYSPRLVIMFASNPALFHTMGIFSRNLPTHLSDSFGQTMGILEPSHSSHVLLSKSF